MKLALCIITEGDSKLEQLQRLIASTDGIFSTIHITANGGEHRTATKRLKQWCESQNIDYSFLRWSDDFSKQRNYNFQRAPKDTDYIVWADSDDVLVGAKHIPTIARISKEKNYDTVFFTYWYGNKFNGEPSVETFERVELQHMRERLIKPRSIIWKKRIHETPVPVDGAHHTYSKISYSDQWPVAWMHLGADRNISKKQLDVRMARNRRLLELELADERKANNTDPRTLLYLMKVLSESEHVEDVQQCIELGEEYLEKSGWDQERALCVSLMAKCVGALGDHQQAVDLLHTAIKEYPYNAMLYLYLARAYINLQNYRAVKHWMEVALTQPVKEDTTSMTNVLELKILSAEILLRYYMESQEKNATKAYDAAVQLYNANPTENNKANMETMQELKELDEPSASAHTYIKFLENKQLEHLIPQFINTMPDKMRTLPFSVRLRNKYKPPKIWGPKEICYFANFHKHHFERWGPDSLNKGLGGSETAVIHLSEKFAHAGYTVVVYADPGNTPIERNGVVYLPFYHFNHRDKFNIFIQWRWASLAGKISAKRFYVDLHDVWNEVDYLQKLDAIDGIFVKSAYHRNLAPSIPDSKFIVASNGI